MKKTNNPSQLSEALAALFRDSQPHDTVDSSALAKAVEQLDDDPAFRADYLKGLFVERIADAMTQEGLAQSEVARRWGKSRQYLSRVLSEDQRINFTLETMVELASLVGRRLDVHVLNPAEIYHMLHCKVTPRTVESTRFDGTDGRRHASNIRFVEFRPSTTYTNQPDDADAARLPA